jgi:hypothetical protein
MKNQLTSFETQYREASLGESPALDLDFMQDLEKRLDEKKRRGGFFLDWFKGMALSITFLIYGMSSFLNEPNLLQVKAPSFQYQSLTHQSKNSQLNSSLSIIQNALPQSENQIEITREASFLPPVDSTILSRQELTIDTPRIGSSLQSMKALVLGLLVPSQLNTFKTQRPQQTQKRKWETSVYSGVNFTKSYLYSDFNVVSSYDLKLTQSESVLTTTNFGLQFYNYSGKLQWGAGILLTSLGEQANYDYLDYSLTPSLTYLGLQDTTYFEAEYVNKNEYQFIQIPLSIGYRFQRNGFSVIPKYSASIGTRVKEQIGYYPNRNGVGMYAFLSPKFNFQQSLQVELRANRQNLFVSLTPYLNFNSVKTPPEIFSYRKYINFGCNLGVGFQFNH